MQARLHAEGLCVTCRRIAEVKLDGEPFWRCLKCRVKFAPFKRQYHMRKMQQIASLLVLFSTGLSAQTPVTLAWDASPTAVDGYRVYVGSDRPGVYMTSLDVGNVLEHTVTGLPAGTWYFVVVAGKGDLWSSVSNEVTVTIGGTTPPSPPPDPPPPDPPQLPTVTVKTLEAISCRVTLTALPPDASGGWRVQFKRGTVSFGTVDSTAPFERTSSVSAGVHSLSAVWTKTGAAAVTYAPTTVNCVVAMAPAPVPTPTPTPIPVPIVTSPEGTRLPPASRIVDDQGHVWTLNGVIVMRDNVPTTGWGTVIAWCGGKVHIFGTDSQWWTWADTWIAAGTVDPCVKQ